MNITEEHGFKNLALIRRSFWRFNWE